MNRNNETSDYEVVDDIKNPQTNTLNQVEDYFQAPPNPKTHLWLDFTLFLLGYLGLMLVPLIYQLIVIQVLKGQNYQLSEIEGYLSGNHFLSLVNFVRYLSIFAMMVALLFLTKILLPIVTQFKKFRTYLYGIGFGFIAIFLSVSYNLFLSLVFSDFGSNQNQNLVEEVIRLHPLLSALWIPFFGPIVEEFTYRLGLFNGLKKVNRTFAYVVTGLIFGLIHFNIPSSTDPEFSKSLLIEIMNLPSYIMSGLLFNYIYDKENLGTSIVAHVTNNLVSYIATIISMNA